MKSSDASKILSAYVDKYGAGFVLEEMQKEAVRLAGYILDFIEINEKCKVDALNGIIGSVSKMDLFEEMLDLYPNDDFQNKVLKEWKDASISAELSN